MDNIEINKTATSQVVKVHIKADSVLIAVEEVTTVRTTEKETGVELNIQKFTKVRSEKNTYRPHTDFIGAMKMLRKPAMQICEFTDFNNFESYSVHGITLKGMNEDETAGVVITFDKTLANGQILNLNTPFTLLGERSSFGDAAKLDKFLSAITEQATLYLGGRYAESPQLTLSFENGTDEEFAVTE